MRISIITVCRNAEHCIEATIQSVLSQTYTNIEYIIIDGASTDGTMNVVNKYRDRINKIISEPDKGIYDAMNKGIALATGDVIYFLNADDKIFDSLVIQEILDFFILNRVVDIVYGKARYFNIPQKISLTFSIKNPQRNSLRNLIFEERIPQQCYFVRKKSFEIVGNFDKNYAVAADYEWLFRAMNSKIKFYFLDRFVISFSLGGISYSKRYPAISEIIKIIYTNSPKFLFIEYVIYAFFRKIYHIFIEEFITPICLELLRRKKSCV